MTYLPAAICSTCKADTFFPVSRLGECAVCQMQREFSEIKNEFKKHKEAA